MPSYLQTVPKQVAKLNTNGPPVQGDNSVLWGIIAVCPVCCPCNIEMFSAVTIEKAKKGTILIFLIFLLKTLIVGTRV